MLATEAPDDLGTYECRNSLCQSANTERYPTDVVLRFDAIQLCLADVDREDYGFDMDLVCPDVGYNDPCPLPLPDLCMQP